MMIGLTIEAMETNRAARPKASRPCCSASMNSRRSATWMPRRSCRADCEFFGVKLWPVIQDLTQLQRDYKEAAWETFMGNAGLLTFLGNTDLTTLEHISKRLGVCEVVRTVVNENENWQTSSGGSRPGIVEQMQGKGGTSFTEGTTIKRRVAGE